ncbi:hypothetical protein Tco_0470824 [Tanacetum coccineum]
MSGEHIRNEYGSSRCTRKEARLLAILTSRVRVWGIDYVAESPVKELSYVPVLDVYDVVFYVVLQLDDHVKNEAHEHYSEDIAGCVLGRTHRTPSTPRSPTPKKDTAESSAPKRSTVIRFRLPERRSIRLTPPAPVPTVDKADEMILQDTLQVSLAEHKSQEEQEARENVELVNKHLASEEIEKMVEGLENVIDDSLHPRNIQAEISSQIQKAIDNQIPSQVDASVRSYMSGHILHVHPAQSQTLSVPEQQYQLYLFMKNDPQLQQQDIAIWLALQMKFENLQVLQTTCSFSAVRQRDQNDPHADAHPEGENSAKRQKTSKYEAYVSGESSSGQVNEEE